MKINLPQSIQLAILLCFFTLGVNAQNSSSLEQEVIASTEAIIISRDSIPSYLADLASKTTKKIITATENLVQLNDPSTYPLLGALYEGNLYYYNKEHNNEGLVIIGEEITTKTTSKYKLYSSYPKKELLLDISNKPITVTSDNLIEVKSNRKVRSTIYPLVGYIDLTSNDVEKRKLAIKSFAYSGTQEDIPLLKTALENEADPITARVCNEAIYALELKSDDVATRLAAVTGIVENKGMDAMSILQERIKKDENGIALETDEEVVASIQTGIEELESRETVLGISQNLFTGLSMGSVLILMALGLAIIYGLMGVINMAHGEFMMIGAYATFVVQSLFATYAPEAMFDYFFLVSLPISFIVAGSIGYIVEKLIIRHLYSKPLESLLATWGLSLVLIQAARSIFGDLTSVSTPAFFSGGYEIVPQLVLPYNRLFIILFTVITVVAVKLLLSKSSFGLKLRAVTQNRNMSACLGISTRKVDALAFFLGTGIAGIAGWAITLIGNVVPNMGSTYIVDSFLVVVTGGVGNLIGTVSSGLGIGFLTKFLEPVFQAVYGKVLILVVIILFLQVKPKGLFPAKGRLED